MCVFGCVWISVCVGLVFYEASVCRGLMFLGSISSYPFSYKRVSIHCAAVQ